MTTADHHRRRVIAHCDDQGYFGKLEDGRVYFFPSGATGAFSAADLTIMANELHRRNAAWDQEIKDALSALEERDMSD